MKRWFFLGVWAFVAGLIQVVPSAECEGSARVILADKGKPLFDIVVSAAASEGTRSTAAVLADYLGRMSGAKYEVREGDGRSGIALGLAEEFPSLTLNVDLDPTNATKREDYLLRSHSQGVWLIGAGDLALRDGVWDFLYRLGYRQYFPGAKWEIIPQLSRLEIDVDSFEHPSYYSRRIWYGYGAWDYAKEPYRDWCEKNRCVQGIQLNTGHAYDGILSRNKSDFAAHPEYLGLVGGERKSTKFCIANPGLRQLVVDDALRQLAADPARQSVSVDPSDGGGWCECAECAKLGSVTDRALTLANSVATGKSAFAKSLGNETGRPTLMLDIGALMGSLVGETERNVRQALRIADAMSPCILFVDELEKGLSGVGGNGDSGVSTRMFGTLLTWMADHTSDVFVIATANDVSKLPPELTRAERLDAVFFLDLPVRQERETIWSKYLAEFGLDASTPRPADEGWTGAEIKSCCRLAALLSVSPVDAAQNVVPVSTTSGEAVEALRTWASGRCISANSAGIYRNASSAVARRRVKGNASLN